jgi:hypothetical protein
MTSLSNILQERQNHVFASLDPVKAFSFARDVKGSDIRSLQAIILNTPNAVLSFQFALVIPLADKKSLENNIINSGCATDAYWFARYIRGADTKALEAVVIARGDAYDAFMFAMNISNANINALLNAIMQNSGKTGYSFLPDFALNFSGLDTHRIKKVVLARNNCEDCYAWATYFPEDIKEMAQSALDNQNSGYAIKFLKLMGVQKPNDPLNTLQNQFKSVVITF